MFAFDDDASKFFAWRFLALATAVLSGSLWANVDADVRRLEPWFQMNKMNGANVQKSLSLDYVSMFALTVPFRATSCRNFSVALVATPYVISTILLPIVCDYLWEVEYNRDSSISIDVNGIGIWMGICFSAVMLAFAVCVTLTLHLRSYGLPRDPAGLAGLASLLYDSDVLADFQNIPVYQTQKFIDNELCNHCFKLQQVFNEDIETSRSFRMTTISIISTPASTVVPPAPEIPQQESFKQNRGEAHPWALWMRFLILPEAVLVAPFIVLWVGITYMGSGEVWSPAVVKGLTMFSSTLSTMSWASIDHAIRLMEPFRQLATDKPNISRVDAVLADYEGMSPIARLFCGSPIVAAVGFGGLLSRFFTIVGPALLETLWKLAYNDVNADVPKTLQTTASVLKYINIPLSLIQFGIFMSVFSRSSPIVPRKPSTLSSKILYLCHSPKLLSDVHEAVIEDGGLTKNLKGQGHDYRFGWFLNDQHQSELRLGVEREPILQPYSYGHNELVIDAQV